MKKAPRFGGARRFLLKFQQGVGPQGVTLRSACCWSIIVNFVDLSTVFTIMGTKTLFLDTETTGNGEIG